MRFPPFYLNSLTDYTMSCPIKGFTYGREDKTGYGQLLFDSASTDKTNTYFKMSSVCFQLSSVITRLWKQINDVCTHQLHFPEKEKQFLTKF